MTSRGWTQALTSAPETEPEIAEASLDFGGLSFDATSSLFRFGIAFVVGWVAGLAGLLSRGFGVPGAIAALCQYFRWCAPAARGFRETGPTIVLVVFVLS